MAKRKPRDALAAAYKALDQELGGVLDSRNLKPGELCRVLNSTPIGSVINDRQLRRHRTKAGFRFGDGQRIDLLRFFAWAFEQHMQSPASEPVPADVDDPFVVATQAEVCKFFGISFNTVKDWARNGMPYGRKSYDLAAIARWVLDRARQPAVGETADRKRSLEVAKLEEEVRSRQRENELEEGRLISRQAIENELAAFLVEIRKQFEQVPRLLKPMLPREHETAISAEVTRLVDAALNGVADRMAQIGPH